MEYSCGPAKLVDGTLVWTVRGPGCAAIVRQDGSKHIECLPGAVLPDAFTSLVNALAEWYQTDSASFKGENAAKVLISL